MSCYEEVVVIPHEITGDPRGHMGHTFLVFSPYKEKIMLALSFRI